MLPISIHQFTISFHYVTSHEAENLAKKIQSEEALIITCREKHHNAEFQEVEKKPKTLER